MASTYSTFKELEASSKITLCIMEGSTRLVGWEVHSGSVYRLSSFDVAVIKSIEDSGSSLTSVNSSASVVPGTYFNDRDNNILYLETSDSSDPNLKFLVLTRKFYFSTHPVSLANDLSSGFEVFWEPLLLSTSQFGVELDNRNQLGFAIEGSGTLTFVNDADSVDTNSFWRTNYTKIFFDNHKVDVYSWNEDLPATEAELIFRGRVKSKRYSDSQVTFQVQDLLSELRGPIELDDISEISGVKVPDGLLDAKQRRIYGRVFGHTPTNIDQIVDGYPLSGTASVTNGSATVTGTATSFFNDISPDDILVINDTEVTVESISSDTSLVLTEAYSASTDGSGFTIYIKPDVPKNYTNRVWQIAGHALRQPETTVINSSSLNFIEVADVSDIRQGDTVFFGPTITGERATVDFISGNFIKLEENLLTNPSVSTAVTRPCVQNVRINNTLLIFDRDYTVDATTGLLTLDELAEFNVAPIRKLNGTLTFTTSSRTVTGTGTNFDAQLRPGMWIRSQGEGDFFEVSSIESETSLTLKTVSTYTDTDAGQYKPVTNFAPGTDSLSLDVLGLTESGAKDGAFIERGAQIVKHLIQDAGIVDIDAASFDTSEDLAQASLGLVIPNLYSDKTTPNFRDAINRVNVSIFGSLIQNNNFELQYNILSPKRNIGVRKIREYDVISFTADTTNQYMAKSVVIEYKNKEYNPSAGETTIETITDTSLIGTYIVRTNRETRKTTLLSFLEDARIFARRWRYLLEIGHTVLKINTKLTTSDLQVNDRIELIHSKLYERIGGGSRKISGIQGIKKSGINVSIEAEDLGDAFSKCSTVTENTAAEFSNSSIDEKVIQGYITDTNGMILNDPETFRLHRIW